MSPRLAKAASSFPEGQNGGDAIGEDPIRVLIVEDHRVVAEGLAALINHIPAEAP